MWLSTKFRVISLLSILIIAAQAQAETFVFETIALTGDPVPGRPSETFSGFEPPALNVRGDVAFRAFFSLSEGVFATSRGSLSSIALAGDRAPGMDDALRAFGAPALNRVGDVAFFAFFNASSGVFETRGGTLNAVAVVSDPAPGTDGDLFSDFSDPELNTRGDVAFVSGHDGTEGVFATRRGVLIGVAPGGTPATGTTGVFRGTSVPNALNDLGNVALSAVADGASGVWVTRAGSLDAIALTGQPTPGGAGTFQLPTAPALNNAGDVALLEAAGSARGVHATKRGTLSPIAVLGDPTPDSSSTFGSFGEVVLNRLGDVAFEAGFDGSSGMFSTRRGRLDAVAVVGDPAPSTTRTFTGFGPPVLNGREQVAFQAALTQGPGGLFVGDTRLDALSKVVAPGDILEALPGDLREVGSIGFSAGSGNQDGRRSGFNDRGQAGVLVRFTDGTSGIFVARPAPRRASPPL